MEHDTKSGLTKLPWLAFLRRYVLAVALLNFIWEIGQLPLYSLWYEQGAAQISYAVVHCTLGDVGIAALALLGSLLIFGNSDWPRERYGAVATAAILAGFVYTGYSEWLNVFVQRSWSYAPSMPIVPVLGVGLSPLMQWMIIPSGVLRVMRPV